MPVENERKYVLHIQRDLEKKIAKHDDLEDVLHIEQAYLLRNRGLTVRIRKQRNNRGKVRHYFTTKQRVGERIIEIEKRIDEFDFTELAKVAAGWVTKVRYGIDTDGTIDGYWVIDFFKHGQETYFIMAEIEMDDGVIEPDFLPRFVVDHLMFKVPKDDCRFSSKKLSDVDYANKLLQEIVSQTTNTNALGLDGIQGG